MKCPDCGYDNPEGAVFCDDCGVSLSEAVAADSESGRGALELGQILSEHWKIAQVVHYDSRCGLYEAEDTQDPERRALVAEGHALSEALNDWIASLHKIELPIVWCPEELAVLDDRLFVVGPWPGEPVSRILDGLEPKAAVSIVRQVLLGIEALRDNGAKQCVISPEHVWCSDGQVTLLQTEPISASDDASSDCAVVIEGFSSPEMFGLMGGKISEASDVFGAGALLYYLLNKGELNIKRLGAGCFGFPNPLVGPGGPLMAVAAKALVREPLERFATVREMRLYLEEALGELEQPIGGAPADEQPAAKESADEKPDDEKPAAEKSDEEAPAEEAAESEAEADAPLSEENKTQPLPKLTAEKLAEAPAAAASRVATEELSKKTEPQEAPRASGKALPYKVGRLSNVGAVRTVNQDAFVELQVMACERDVPVSVHFLAVIDGMGGEAEGDKAASIAARSASREVLHSFLNLPGEDCEAEKDLPLAERQAAILQRAMKQANADIYAYACEAPERRGMGCTMSAALISDGILTVGHVGDTRGYHYDGELHQITRDHSVVGQLVELGALTKEEARHSPKRSLIYRALGTGADVEVETYQRIMNRGDYLFMSSDGIWEYYSDEELSGFFAAGGEPQAICDQLVATCLRRGADDNTTAIVFRYLP